MTEIISNAFCLALFLGLGVSTPQGSRYNEPILQNERYSEFNAARKFDEPAVAYDVKYKPNGVMGQEAERDLLFQNAGYNQNTFQGNREEISLNTQHVPLNPSLTNQEYQRESVLNKYEISAINNEQRILHKYPEDFKNINIQRNIMPRDKEELINEERNIKKVKDLAPAVLYKPSLSQVNRIQNFRPNYEENREINVPGIGAMMSESNNNRNVILSKVNSISQINHINERLNLPVERLANSMDQNRDEDGIQIDVPIATPEYINSILNNYKPMTQRNLVSLNGQARVGNILSNPQRLKDIYISSKPSKRYMVVYPDGRVEQVDELEKIQKNYPNYVMLQAKELLQKSQVNPVITPEIRGSDKPVLSTISPILPINPLTDSKTNQLNKIDSQTVKDQKVPVTTDTVIGPYKDAEDLLSDLKLEKAEIEPINPVQQVSSYNENVISTPEISQGQNILDKNEYPNPGHNEIIPTTEIPSKEEIVTTTKNTVSVEPDPPGNNQVSDNQDQHNRSSLDNSREIDQLPTKSEKVTDNHIKPNKSTESNENYEEGKTTETSNPEIRSPNEDTELSNQSLGSDISSSPTPPELSQNTEASKTNVSNETVTADGDKDSNGKIPSTEVEKKYDDENVDSIAPGTESDINSTTSEATSLFSPVNPETTDPTIDRTTVENESKNITNYTPLLSNGGALIDGEEASNSTQPESISSISSQGDNKNTSKVQSSDVYDDASYKDASPSRNNSESIPLEDDVSREESDLNKKPSLSLKQNVSNSEEELNPISKESVKENSSIAIDDVQDTVINSSPDSGLSASNNGESSVPIATSYDSYYQNSTDKNVEERRYEDEDDKEETSNDKLQTDVSTPPASAESTDSEPSWFNFNESLLKKLLSNDDLHNSFYFLFPRPKPNIKETKETIYPNGTVVIETTQTMDADDGEKTTSKSTHRCVSCRACNNT
ncbi:homeobox-like protein HDP1 isoform X2 [Danaus plexippus]|uniref:homeobox-like protein HDP1 isoform X2 n=1 Tax=Danaus plexippus TaxID=13037 RepID=UPI002AB159F9|nr:homeobox-like protein HDP1 isoform X2 [Danaus plexippus]